MVKTNLACGCIYVTKFMGTRTDLKEFKEKKAVEKCSFHGGSIVLNKKKGM